MKKILSTIFALSVAVSMMAFHASAVSPDLSAMTVRELADLDVYSASPEVQQMILNARAEIIYGDQAWTVNGAVSVFDAETGTTETLPEFSDVFPGWSLFEIEAAASGDPDVIASAIRLTTSGRFVPGYVPSSAPGAAQKDNGIHFTEAGYFTQAADFMTGVPATRVAGNGNTIGVGAVTDPCDGARYSLSVSCGTMQVGWKPDLKVGQAITFSAAAGRTYSIRGGACGQEFEGHYLLQVTENLDAFS